MFNAYYTQVQQNCPDAIPKADVVPKKTTSIVDKLKEVWIGKFAHKVTFDHD